MATAKDNPLRRIGACLSARGVEHWGICSFADCLPLLPCRAAQRLPSDPQSVILCLFPYWTGEFSHRNVARYAILPDYHDVVVDILEDLCRVMGSACPGEAFVPFVDNSPIPEVKAANRAGLGAVGKHGQLLSPAYGGYVFIGSVVTTLALPPSEPGGKCPGCGRCVAACPSSALTAQEPFRPERCRSFLTQKKGELTPWEQSQIRQGGLVWGCDLCTDACPVGRPIPTPIRAFTQDPAPVVTLENLDRLRTTKAYGYRGRRVLERNLLLVGQENRLPNNKE